MGLAFFPRGGSAHVARNLAAALGGAGWDVTVLSGSLTRAGEPGDAREFYAGLDVRPVDMTAALAARRSDARRPADAPVLRGPAGSAGPRLRLARRRRVRAPGRRLVPGAAVGRRGARGRAAPAPPDADPRGGRARGARRAGGRPPARDRAADAGGDRRRAAAAGRTRRRGPSACAPGRPAASA